MLKEPSEPKICLVTGGSSGVGKAIALGLAKRHFRVVILSRDIHRGERALAEIRGRSGNDRVELMHADLASQRSIREFAGTFKKRYPRLNVLSNNAGTFAMKRSVTEDGIETNLAVNYLSHFLLTNLLSDVLKAGAPSRVMTVSGAPGTMSRLRIHFDDVQFEDRYHPLQAFLQAGLARALFSLELARRWDGTGISSHTFHPGLIRSNLAKALPWYLRWPALLVGLFMGTDCRTGIYVATSQDLAGSNGRFFVNRRSVDFKPAGYDVQQEAGRLWELSEELVRL